MKRYYRYQIAFSERGLFASVCCMAAAFFATLVAYLGLQSIAGCNFFEIVFSAILPTILSASYVVLIHFKKRNAPGLYGLIGAVFCLCYIVGCFLTGEALRAMLGLVWYLCCSIVLLACTGGFLPGKLPVTVMFAASIVARILFSPVKELDIAGFVGEISILLSMAALVLLPQGLKPVKGRNAK